MEFHNIRPAIFILIFIAVVTCNGEKSDIEDTLPKTTPESVIENLMSSPSEVKPRVKRQFGGYGYDYPYYGRRRPYPPIIFGGIGFGGFGGPGFGIGRGFGGRGGGRGGFGGRGGGFGGRGGGIGGRGGGGGHGGGRG